MRLMEAYSFDVRTDVGNSLTLYLIRRWPLTSVYKPNSYGTRIRFLFYACFFLIITKEQLWDMAAHLSCHTYLLNLPPLK